MEAKKVRRRIFSIPRKSKPYGRLIRFQTSKIPKVYYFYLFGKNLNLKLKLGVLLISILAIVYSFGPPEQGPKVDTNAKIKAVFIYNFTRYIEWPSDYQAGEFTIGILGENDALQQELTKMSKVKKVSNQSFSIRTYGSLTEVSNPHILYIPGENTSELNNVVTKLNGKSTLIVTEKPGMARQGSAINFVVDGNRQKFELNKSNVERHNLKVASALEKLAVLVN